MRPHPCTGSEDTSAEDMVGRGFLTEIPLDLWGTSLTVREVLAVNWPDTRA